MSNLGELLFGLGEFSVKIFRVDSHFSAYRLDNAHFSHGVIASFKHLAFFHLVLLAGSMSAKLYDPFNLNNGLYRRVSHPWFGKLRTMSYWISFNSFPVHGVLHCLIFTLVTTFTICTNFNKWPWLDGRLH